jgi:mono/diheme cytochrome c family protein
VTSARILPDATVAAMRAAAVTALLVAALAAAGCGGSTKGEPSGGSGSSTDGKSLFAGTCGSCHTLADAGTTGTFGPNLDHLKPDQARVEHAIATGPGAMPDHLYKGAQAKAIANYVAGAAGK